MFGFAPLVDYDTVRLQMGFWDALEISRSIASFLMGRFFALYLKISKALLGFSIWIEYGGGCSG